MNVTVDRQQAADRVAAHERAWRAQEAAPVLARQDCEPLRAGWRIAVHSGEISAQTRHTSCEEAIYQNVMACFRSGLK